MARDTDSARVQTYIPDYQKEVWREHADRLGMSQSEFVRTMVQAGRRKFEVPALGESAESAETEELDGDSRESDDNTSLESHVVEALSTGEFRSWDELVEAVTDDIEGRLDDTLQRLQTQNRVQFSGRHGGYTLVEGADGD